MAAFMSIVEPRFEPFDFTGGSSDSAMTQVVDCKDVEMDGRGAHASGIVAVAIPARRHGNPHPKARVCYQGKKKNGRTDSCRLQSEPDVLICG